MFEVGDDIYVVTKKGVKLSKIKKGQGYMVDIIVNKDQIFRNGNQSTLIAYSKDNYFDLVEIFGEYEVPRLDRSGSNLTRKLIKEDKNVLCYLSNISDADALYECYIGLVLASCHGEFVSNCVEWKFAVPVGDSFDFVVGDDDE